MLVIQNRIVSLSKYQMYASVKHEDIAACSDSVVGMFYTKQGSLPQQRKQSENPTKYKTSPFCATYLSWPSMSHFCWFGPRNFLLIETARYTEKGRIRSCYSGVLRDSQIKRYQMCAQILWPRPTAAPTAAA